VRRRSVPSFGPGIELDAHIRCLVVYDDGSGPALVCVPPSGSFFPRGITRVTCTATDASGNQSSCVFPVTVELEARRR